jgi:hypothetical protein
VVVTKKISLFECAQDHRNLRTSSWTPNIAPMNKVPQKPRLLTAKLRTLRLTIAEGVAKYSFGFEGEQPPDYTERRVSREWIALPTAPASRTTGRTVFASGFLGWRCSN